MRKSRLGQDKQDRLMEHFVAGATARTSASLVGVNKTTAAYYFHRLREIIYLATEDETPLLARLRWMRAILAAEGKAHVAVGRRVKCQYLAF